MFGRPLLIATILAVSWSSNAWAQPGSAEDEMIEELNRVKQMQANSMQMLNSMNPLSSSPSLQGGASFGQADPAVQQLMQNLQSLEKNPVVQTLRNALQKPEFTRALDQILRHPKKKELLYAQIGWILFMMLFRAWRLSRPGHWLLKIWTRLWTFALLTGGTALVVPTIILGEPYLMIIRSLIGAWK